MRRLKSFYFMVPLVFLLGCASTNVPDSAKIESDFSLQQTAAECSLKGKKLFLMGSQNQSGIYRGFLKRDLYGSCMDEK
jgi:thioredoxin-related protein